MKKFSAKLLLFGEYGLIIGANALAIPFPAFKGQLKFANEEQTDRYIASRNEMKRFVSHFIQHQLNKKMNFPLQLEQLQNDLTKGLFFSSTIPELYGIGSSGALCAAIFDNYSTFPKAPEKISDEINVFTALKNDFIKLEAFFHGRSSGIDPLVCFLNQPVLINGNTMSLPEIDTQPSKFSGFLIDTGEKSATAPLIRVFMEKIKNENFKKRFKKEFIPANNMAIKSFIQKDVRELFHQLHRISSFQSQYFSEMIPAAYRELFQRKPDSKTFVKLLGAGGGGFLLAFSQNINELPKNISKIKVF